MKVILSSDYDLKSIIISENAKKESQEIINDLIIALTIMQRKFKKTSKRF